MEGFETQTPIIHEMWLQNVADGAEMTFTELQDFLREVIDLSGEFDSYKH